MKRAVITGLGVIAPNGLTVSSFWDSVQAGRVVIEDDPLMIEINLQCHGVARCHGFQPGDLDDDDTLKEVAGLGRFAQLGAAAASQAATDAGLPIEADRCAPGGVVFASAVGGAPEMQLLYERLTGNGTTAIRPAPLDSSAYDGIFLDALPALLARRYGLTGPTATLTTGCTAGLDALGLAVELVRHGEAPFVIAGAGESPLNGISYATLDVIGCLSRTDGPVQRASRPFDATRAGFVISEGAAFVVVEEAEHAERRGARPHAEVLGWASTSNAHHMTDLLSDGRSMESTLHATLTDSHTAPEAIDYINAHGSSTPQNDLFETNAIKSVFGDGAYQIPISSLKSMIGHSLSSASLMALVATIGAMHRATIPPTANFENPDPACDLDYVVDGPRYQTVERALVMASGFGGIHTAAVLRGLR
ncbi:MAG: beta-ketoacyl-[acyl-carrier-protein] synthase family protein [Pseudonocardiaceae bacterium]